jgi:hypothetical protein
MTTISMVAKSVWHPRNARMAIATHGALHPAGPFFLLLLFYVLGFEMLFPDQVKTLFINAFFNFKYSPRTQHYSIFTF